ncbi:MAG: hypothetical protein K0R65_1976 [Crocinitomicaceae bacterium]|jgi:hypothetical protein|nr:hypothetical protein [Crocinitomicaceae bacterium]
MKIINRGFIIVKPKQAFWDWANQFDQEFTFSEDDDCEGSVYLIEEDFMEFEPVLEKNFKKIMKNELAAVADEEDFPEKITFELFSEWFHVDFGSSVFDLEKSDLKSEKTD